MRIIISGVPGAGKTSVIKQLKEELKNDILVLSFGSEMLEIAKHEYNIVNRDDMRKMNRKQMNELQLKAINNISKKEKEAKFVIIDTHLAIKTRYGYMPGFPHELLDKIKPEIIVLIRAKPEEIWERRQMDDSRKRDKDSINDIIEHEKANISYLISYSALSGAYALIVRNENGQVQKAVDKIKSLFEQ